MHYCIRDVTKNSSSKFVCFCFLVDIDTDAVESYVAEETIEFLVDVEESVIDDEWHNCSVVVYDFVSVAIWLDWY